MTKYLHPEQDLVRALNAQSNAAAAAPARSVPTCPECVAGKHRNCNGQAWDDAEDGLTECRCAHGLDAMGMRP